MAETLRVFRVEYEIIPKGDGGGSRNITAYTAFIVGYTPEETFAYLEMLIGKGRVNMTSVGFQCELHGFTPQARSFLNPPGTPKEGFKEVIVNTDGSEPKKHQYTGKKVK